MNKWHKNLTQEKWTRYSLKQQMLMIGSELSRLSHLKDNASQNNCLERAFELIDLTIDDSKLGAGRKELLRLREALRQEYKGIINPQKIKQYYQYCLDFAKLNNGT